MAGALFVEVIGLPLLEGQSEGPPPASDATDMPSVEPQQRPWNDPDRHRAWPECDCPVRRSTPSTTLARAFADHHRSHASLPGAAPLVSAHIRANSRNSSSSHPRVAAS